MDKAIWWLLLAFRIAPSVEPENKTSNKSIPEDIGGEELETTRIQV